MPAESHYKIQSQSRAQSQSGGRSGDTTKTTKRKAWLLEVVVHQDQFCNQLHDNDHGACHFVLSGLHKLDQILKISVGICVNKDA